MNNKLLEDLIQAWIKSTSSIKNNRIFSEISYNEAIILNLCYNAYLERKGIYTKEIIQTTKMLKSLVNRTLNYLRAKNFIYTTTEKKQVIVYFNPQMEESYKKIHEHTIDYVLPIINKLGEENIKEFIRITNIISEEL